MNYTDYLQVKEDFIMQLAPHKEVELTEVQHESDQLYSVDGVEVPASRRFADSYDTIIGIKPKQKALVRNASGETGLSNYRNYQSVAMSIHKPQKVLIVASPESHQLTEVIPIVEEYIAPTLFFDFAEMVAHETGYEIVKVNYSPSVNIQATITFQSRDVRQHYFFRERTFLWMAFTLHGRLLPFPPVITMNALFVAMDKRSKKVSWIARYIALDRRRCVPLLLY